MPEEPVWRGFFEPHTILQRLGLTPGCGEILDFGCGYGTFAIPAARITSGIVHALDIEPEMVSITRRKAEEAGLTNLHVQQRDFVADGSGLPEGSIDYAMLFNLLHAEERMSLLREAWRVLKVGGQLAIIHWNYDATTPRGPTMSIRPRPEDCRAWAEQVGFELLPPGQINLPPYHYGFVFHRK
jgi:ubiquinone/menaquinone biosynthesis C-methylase UbiE